MEDENEDSADEEKVVIPTTTSLPPHVIALLYQTPIRNSKECISVPNSSFGIISCAEIRRVLDAPKKPIPWLKKKEDLRSKSNLERGPSLLSSRQNRHVPAVSDMAYSMDIFSKSKTSAEKLFELENVIKKNPNKKIAFIGQPFDTRSMPSYVTTRLETACRSARYTLPLNMKLLEKMTQLEYITAYTRLYKEQKTRYEKVYRHQKKSSSEFMDFKRLYPALDSMFGGFLSKHNFKILCTALFIDDRSAFDMNTFEAICTLCDRFFWTTYLDGLNSFNYWAPNRSAVEVTDFHNLRWKLRGVKINPGLEYLLFSLA